MNFICAYKDICGTYSCTVISFLARDDNSKIGTFLGQHRAHSSNQNVKSFDLHDATTQHFPMNLGIQFSHLQEVRIVNCLLTEISREDLLHLKFLSVLDVQGNQIKLLPDDLFINNQNFLFINFRRNKIEFASSKLLEPIKRNVAVFNLSDNVNIDMYWSLGRNRRNYGNLTKSATAKFLEFSGPGICCDTVEELMSTIDERCKRPNEFLRERRVDELKRSVESMTHTNSPSCDPTEKELGQIFIDGFRELRQSARFTDFVVIAGSKEFPVHKAVLAIQSSVLATMFERKTKDRQAIKLEILDISSEAVKAFIDFLYERKRPSFEDAIEVFKLAAKYEVVNLKSLCEAIMRDNLNESNAFDIFKVASGQYKSDELKLAAFRKIQETLGTQLKDVLMDKPEKLEEIFETKRRLNALMEGDE